MMQNTRQSSMSELNTFTEQLYTAIDLKVEWYDTIQLYQLLVEYRNYHTIIKNLYDMLSKKGLITEDPYKKDKKVADISVPDETDFLDTEKSIIMGIRLSDYENSLDFMCTYFKFSIASLTLDRLKLLVKLNNYIKWQSLQSNSARPNTRALAKICNSIRTGSDPMAIKVLNDFITVASKTLSKINNMLKELVEFQKEVYKATLRKTMEEYPKYSKEKATASAEEALAQIKELFPAVLGKRPFYKELIDEILAEDFAPNKETLQLNLLNKLSIKVQHTHKKNTDVDTKTLLMNTLRTLGSITPQLEQVLKKISTNQHLLENENKTFWDKFSTVIRKAFNIEQPHIDYKLMLEDPITQLKQYKTINYTTFISSLSKMISFYNSFAIKNTPGYMKLEVQEDKDILIFINDQLAECKKITRILESLSDFFKKTIRPINREHLENWTLELTSIQNTLIKTAQRKAEYTSYIEEQQQMEKLGITDE
jgi:hypothetical protein